MTRLITSLIASSAILVSAQNDAMPQMTEPNCKMDGSKLVCTNIMSMMEDMQGILSSYHPVPSMFDYRQAEGCTCTAEVTNGSETKVCGCSVCPAGYGLNPLSVDCGDLDDPYVLDTCTKLDCNFDCDGACTGGCDVDPLPKECASMCTRDEDLVETTSETASDSPSDVPSDTPSDWPSDQPSDSPSDQPIHGDVFPTDPPAFPTNPSSPPVVFDISSGASSPYRQIAFALASAAAVVLCIL